MFTTSNLKPIKGERERGGKMAFNSYLYLFSIVLQVIDELGSFNVYIWNFVNHKPIVSQFRYPRQVPDKTSKAEVISKDLVKRGFRSVGPTVIYTFMQVAGLTNDHLISCFRFQECIETQTAEKGEKDGEIKLTVNEKMPEALKNLEL